MNTVFYDHLLPHQEISEFLDKYPLDSEEKAELLALVDELFHHHTLNVILNHLPQEHHQTFVMNFHQAPFDSQLMAFLKSQISADIEQAIKTQAERVKKEILTEIKKTSLKK
jgi:hypothetical protein